jgi:uncharacterized membrane protein
MTAVPIEVLLALGTALAFATSSVLVRFGVERSSPMSALVVTVSINVVVLWAASLALYEVTVDLWAWRYFIVAGVFAPVLGRLCNYIGLQRLGVNLTLPISNSNPLVSVLLALLLLGETLSVLGGIGALATIAGGVILASSNRGDSETVDVRYRDLLFPVAGAVIYGSVQLLRKVGVDLVPAPSVGAAVNLTTSWIIAVIFVTFSSNRRDVLSIPRDDIRYFVLAGVASSLGLICLYAALLSGTVVIVTPILNATPLFALLLTFLFLREREPFTPRVIVGTALLVAGIGLLATAS